MWLFTPKISCTTIRPPRGLPEGSARYAPSLWPSPAVNSIILPKRALLRILSRRKVYFVLWHNVADPASGARHARHRAQPLSDPRERSRADQGFLLQGPRLRSDAASRFSVSRLLAGRQRQDPGAHGAGRGAELEALLPRQPEERGDEQLRRDRPYRLPR